MQLEKLDPKPDDRGMFVEAFHDPGQVSYVYCEEGYSRGNHYHLRKIEKFICIGGVIEMTVKDRDTGTVMNVILSSGDPMTVTIHPNNTHMFKSLEGTGVCLIWCSEHYNPDDPDTYPEEL